MSHETEKATARPAQGSGIRVRKCPSCGRVVDLLQLSAFSLPVEQATIPWLRMVNGTINSSLRTFGQSNINELQYLCFTFTCGDCSLISWWDVGTEELEHILNNLSGTPKIGWASKPEQLVEWVQKLPEPAKGNFQALLDVVLKIQGGK